MRRRAAREAEAKVIVEALKQYQGNVSAVARRMQVTPRAIHMKLRSLGINAAAFRNGQNAPQD
ncbi:MAG: helix-turn-helix domain-containing protein [Gammaproteobacteria bacterium]